MFFLWVLVRNDAALTPEFFENKKLKDRVFKAYYLARLSVVYNSIFVAIKKEVVQSGENWALCRESGSEAEVRQEADKLKRFLERPVSEYLKDNVRLSRFLHDRVIKKIAGLEFFNLVVGDFLSGIGIHISIK